MSGIFSTIITHLGVLILLSTQNPSLVHSKHQNGPSINVTKHLSFPNFNPSTTNHDIKLLGNAELSQTHNFLQIPHQDLKHQAGRALYSSPVRLFDPATETPASFQTTFSFQFLSTTNETTSDGGGGGSGLAFIIVPDEFTVGRAGPWLAMINDACDEDDDYNKAVAIEFDTRFNPEFGDPSDNHVGIDLGTMVSAKAFNASRVGVSLNDGSIHRAWISYNGPNRSIDVRLGSDGQDSWSLEPVYSGPLDISPYLHEYMFVGFSASTGDTPQRHVVFSWNFTSKSQAFLRVPSTQTCENKIVINRAGKMTKTKPPSSFLIFISVVFCFTVAIIISLYYFNTRRQNDKSLSSSLSFLNDDDNANPKKPRKFTFAELSIATASFDEGEIMGRDSRGVYFKAKLLNCHVAVKRFSPSFVASSSARRLAEEVRNVSRARHPNLVPIRGLCEDKRRNEVMVVYDFVSNGSLDKWLFGVGVLPWTRRFKVVIDVAKGLAFLHSNKNNLAHKNVKMSSVFVDVSFRGLLGDFGFVRCGSESRRFESAVSQSTDVFELGLLMLEVVSGKRNVLELSWRLHEEGDRVSLVDKRMGKAVNLEQVNRVIETALLCTLNEFKGRPNMDEVVQFLSFERPVPELPPSRPVCLFPYNSVNVGLCSGYPCASFK